MRRLFILGILMLVASPVHAADPVRNTDEPVHCPAVLDIRTNKYYLQSAGLFNSEAQTLIPLKPEDGSWNLEDYRPTAQKFFMVCHYEDTLSSLTIAIPPDVHLCDQTPHDIECR